MMYFLDTDTLSHLHEGNTRIINRLKNAGEENVATTIITAIETLRGRHEFIIKAADGTQLIRAQQLLDKSERMLRATQIFRLDARAAAEFDRLRLVKKLKIIGRRDLLIGCVTLAHDATLVTRNLKDFRLIPGLKLENWVD